MPDYFFEVAASSTGKYHPTYALGEGGLVRHTKAAVMIADELLKIEMYDKFKPIEKDLILTALILHDGFKHGKIKSDFTVSEHPLIAAEWVKEIGIQENLSNVFVDILIGAMSSHMGQWNTDYKTKEEILPKPNTPLQKFVHQADYLASRKFLEVSFGDDYYDLKKYQGTDQLAEVISSILNLFKSKIESGVDKNLIYQMISDNNEGKKNPNSITNIETAKIIKEKLEGIN